LDPDEFKVLQELKSRKRSFINPDDPILSPKGKFKRNLPDVYSTNKVVDVMTAFGRQANKNKMSVEEIKQSSRDLNKKYCDRDVLFFK
jgi:hypothetical protein